MAITDAVGICNLAMHRLGAEKVSDVTISGSSAEEIACYDVYDQIRDEMLQGMFAVPEVGDYNWQFAKRHLQLNKAPGYDESDYDEITITGITKADPAVVTAASHGFSDGWLVYINDVSGMTEINGFYVRVANQAANTFECYGIDSSKFTAYSSGGTVIRKEPFTDYHSGYSYEVPADFLKIVAMEDNPQFELVGSGNSERILCDAEDPILVYIAQVTTITEFPIAFIRALAGRIAYELAPGLSPKNIDQIYAMYAKELYDAISSDAKSVTPGSLITDNNRYADAGGWG